MKKQLSILQTFLVTCLLLVIGGGTVMADETTVYTLDFTTKSVKSTNYTSDWTYTSNQMSWTINGAANNNGGWAYLRTGGKTQNYSYYKSKSLIEGNLSSIVIQALNTYNNASFTMKSIKVIVSSDANFSNVIDEVYSTSIGKTMTFKPSAGKEWRNAYYQFYFEWKNNAPSKNHGMDIEKVIFNQDSNPFKFSVTSCTAMLGATNIEFPTLTNGYGTSVTYSSSNTDVVSEFNADGTPILKAIGTTTITATLDADNSVSASYDLTVNQLTNSIAFSANGGTFNKAPQVITLTAGIEGSKIYYTTNGDEPTTESDVYVDGVTVTKTGTVIKALAVADAVENVTATSNEFVIKPDRAVFSVDSKTFKDPLDVELSLPATTDATSKIYYAIGSVPNESSTVYDGTPVRIESEEDGAKVILHAKVCDEYGNWSSDSHKTYTKTTAVVFDFTERPNAWEIEPTSENSSTSKSNVVGKTLYMDGIGLTTTSGSSNITCIYASTATAEPNLRVYDEGSITFTSPLGYNISKIVLTGKTLGSFSAGTNGSYSTSNSTWTGNAKSVTLSSSGSIQVKTASVTLVKVDNAESISLPASDADYTYCTFSCSRDVIFTNDVIVNKVKVEDAKLVITPLDEAVYETTDETQTSVTGYYVPANTGVLVEGMDATAAVYYPKDAQIVSIADNQLKPAPVNGGMIETETGHKYYKLAYLDFTNKAGLGFYWGADNGGAFKVKPGTAYLEVPDTSSPAKGFAFGGDETGITNIDANSSNSRVIYNLAGQRMSDTVKPGLYIINGKKTVVR